MIALTTILGTLAFWLTAHTVDTLAAGAAGRVRRRIGPVYLLLNGALLTGFFVCLVLLATGEATP